MAPGPVPWAESLGLRRGIMETTGVSVVVVEVEEESKEVA
jgi:hypothetical protein